jgi:hypothetical protein
MVTAKGHSVSGEVNDVILVPRDFKSRTDPVFRSHRACCIGCKAYFHVTSIN